MDRGTQNWRSEMNPDIAGASMSTTFEGCKRSADEYVDQVGATYARAVLKPRDLNREDGRGDDTQHGRFGKLYIPRMRPRKQPRKESLPVQLTSDGHSEYRETESSDEGKCASEENVCPDQECLCQALEEYESQTSNCEDQVQVPSYSGTLLQQRDRDRGCEIVSMPVRIRKPRFPRIRSKRQQNKQNKPKKDEPNLVAILKRDELAPASGVELHRRPEELQTFEELAEQFCFTDECTAMMTHLDLNSRFERMPYTAMFKK